MGLQEKVMQLVFVARMTFPPDHGDTPFGGVACVLHDLAKSPVWPARQERT